MNGIIDKTDQHDSVFMRHALRLAQRAAQLQEVPVGAVLVRDNAIIGEGFNRTLLDTDPSAHAEVVALRAAARQQRNHRLPGSTLYCTLEPCCMCAGAIVQARVARVVYACDDPRSGAVRSLHRLLSDSRLNHRCTISYGLLADDSATLLRTFFALRR